MSASPRPEKDDYGKGFGTCYTNFKREDTKKSKASKTIDLQRRQKLILAEKERLKNLRKVGNVLLPKDAIKNLFKLI
jgi:translation elongation factor EF-4